MIPIIALSLLVVALLLCCFALFIAYREASAEVAALKLGIHMMQVESEHMHKYNLELAQLNRKLVKEHRECK